MQTQSRLPRVLIADDMQDVRYIVKKLLTEEGFEPLVAADGQEALDIIREGLPDIVLLDIKMPKLDGMQVLKQSREFISKMPIIMLTSFGSIPSAVEAVRNGAYDYLTKPFDNDELVLRIRRTLESCLLKEENRRLRSRLDRELSLEESMGQGERIRRVCAEVERVAPTDFTVVITGETGSGKELVANAIHALSLRTSNPFVPVDCGSLPETLIESELFGHEKGSFTGADRVRPGKFELASGGTLLLDEVSNLPLLMQSKLLRSLQEKRICRVGGTKHIGVDIRVLAATNRDLEAMVTSGDFRRDLYHRLNEFAIEVPPLRERPEDIMFLAKRFLDMTNAELSKDVHAVSEAALEALSAYRWPGNVRELRNVIRRAVLLADASIAPEHLSIANPPPETNPSHSEPSMEFDYNAPLKHIVRRSVEQVERRVLTKVLERTGGNKARAARILQIDYKTMHTKVKQYGILSGENAQGQG